MQKRRHERPIPRTNPSGEKVWVARYTDRHGKRKSAGTFKLRRDAQDAIDAAYEQDAQAPARFDTVGAYAATWTKRHPRQERTNKSYNHRVGRVLDVELDGRRLRDWPMAELRRRHANDLVDHLLTVQKRAAKGALGVVRVLSAMFEDAIDDEVCETNPFHGVKVKASDPRVVKAPKVIRVFSWEQMHGFCRAAAGVSTSKTEEPTEIDGWRAVYAEAMLRVLSDCGLRLGELLPLERTDLRGAGRCGELVRIGRGDARPCPLEMPHVHVQRTAHEGLVQSGTKTDHGQVVAGRAVPLPEELEALVRGLPPRIDTRLLFPTPRGHVWRESQFYRDVWWPAREPAGIRPTPHEFRHSWISHLQAAGVDPADLAAMAGHTVQTMVGHYTHSVGRSYEAVRKAVGQ